MGAVSKSYVMKGFLINEEMRKYLVNFGEAVSHIWLWKRFRPDFLIYEENLISFFISVPSFRFLSAAGTDNHGTIFFFKEDFLGFILFKYNIQHCLICRPSDSCVSEDAGFEPRTQDSCD